VFRPRRVAGGVDAPGPFSVRGAMLPRSGG
jgi:hypothetical protein